MQRDIDERRAETHLQKYLNPQGSDPSKPGRHTVFFPPLLIACVPSSDNRVRTWYPEETRTKNASNDSLVRTWGDIIQMVYFTKGGAESYELHFPDGESPISIDPTNVEVKFRVSQDNEPGVKLIAIDGQHRLWALKQLAAHPNGVISNLVIPTCILFSTSASESGRQYHQALGVAEVPNVPQTFRKVFVDVNSKMEAVGAHTTILLNDTDIGSLIVREFCSRVNQQWGSFGLSCVEWNVKGTKDSRQLNRDHSITSIGILEKALEETFGRGYTPMSRLVDIEDVEVKAQLDAVADDPSDPRIEWGAFSIAQRDMLVERARSGVVDLLFKVFFECETYGAAYEHYSAELQRFEDLAGSNREDSADYRQALQSIVNFQLPKEHTEAYQKVRRLGKSERLWREENLAPVMGFALYQRAILLTLREMVDALPDSSIQAIGKGLGKLLDLAMARDLALFEPSKAYTTKTVWHESGAIVNREQTRRQLSRLLLGVLGGSEAATAVVAELSDDQEKATALVDRLGELGEERVSEYWEQYMKDRYAYFKRTYATNLALSEDQVEELRQAEIRQSAEMDKVKAGELEEEDAEKPLDSSVRAHLATEFRKAELQLRTVLRLDKHIVGSEFLSDEFTDSE